MVTKHAAFRINDLDEFLLAVRADAPPEKWSDLKYVFWHQGGSICRGRGTRLKRSSPSFARSTSWSLRARTSRTASDMRGSTAQNGRGSLVSWRPDRSRSLPSRSPTKLLGWPGP